MMTEDQKIDAMSVEEYNEYIRDIRKKEVKSIIKKIAAILDTAYINYIKCCKKNRIYIQDCFAITEGQYGITYTDMMKLVGRESTTINNYIVSYEKKGYLVVKPIKD